MTDPGINPKDAIASRKPDLSLVPAGALVQLARVMELGARKYGSYNWRSAKVRARVYVAAALRHLGSYLDGEDTDPESGQPHVAHAMACCAILLDAAATDNLVDDRPTPGAAARLIAEMTEAGPEPGTITMSSETVCVRFDCENFGKPLAGCRPPRLDTGRGFQPMRCSTGDSTWNPLVHGQPLPNDAGDVIIVGSRTGSSEGYT